MAAARERILSLHRAVGKAVDMSLYQFAQFTSAALEFAPDLILELGRYLGNSTCAFTEAANLLGGARRCRVVSLCYSVEWEKLTVPKLRGLVPPDWLAPLEARRGDIVSFDYRRLLEGAGRVLLFWDAHGFEVAECVLATILPLLADRAHVVMLHDMSDVRYAPETSYQGRGLWKGRDDDGSRIRVGLIDSAVPQSIAVQDFAARNRITLDSADHSFDVELKQVPGRVQEMRALLGDELFSLEGHWFWFTLNERPGPYTFPRPPALKAPWFGSRDAASA